MATITSYNVPTSPFDASFCYLLNYSIISAAAVAMVASTSSRFQQFLTENQRKSYSIGVFGWGARRARSSPPPQGSLQ
jgi:hypothetical protein